MKKVLSILCSMVFVLAIMFVAGCSGLSNFSNETKGIIYNGGNSVVVGDYLFYANGYASDYTSFSDMTDYNKAKEYAFLARVNLKDFSAEDKYTSSENVEVVSADDVVGFAKTYIFAYGQQVYYVAPNVHKTNENKNAFKYLTFFKINFDGSGKTEIYTTENEYDTTKGQMVAVQYGESAYLIVYDGTVLVSFDITNGKVAKNAYVDKVTSVALPKENNNWDGNLYYTKDKDTTNQSAGNEIYKIKVDGTNDEKITPANDVNYTTTFLGRVNNTIYYKLVNENNSISYSYYATANDIASKRIATAGKIFYKTEVSNIIQINGGENFSRTNGIVFTSNDKIMYKNTTLDTEPQAILSNYSNARIICTVGTDLYFETASGIFKVSINDLENVITIVSSMTITTDAFGYNATVSNAVIGSIKEVYFFAQRTYDENAEKETIINEDGEEEEVTDENVYLYRVNLISGETQIMGKTV